MHVQKTIGIMGGGQLGRMLTLAALPLDFKVVVIDPSENCPAAQVGAEQIKANLYDPEAIAELGKRADYITVEIEHFDTTALKELASKGISVNPTPETIELIQDKFRQKEFLAENGIPVAPFSEITSRPQALATLKAYGGSMMLKTRHGAYDGRGNALIKSESELNEALGKFFGAQLYAEKIVKFKKELAVMLAIDVKGNAVTYPVVETVHVDSICTEVYAPADIKTTIQNRAKAVALEVGKHLHGAGMFGIEMFLTKNNEIFINEIAPRVHNSGHYTTEACVTSQFEQHIRAIAHLPLGETKMVHPAAVMVNILGERNAPTEVTGLARAISQPQTGIHLYGKSPTKIARKMGHITSTGESLKVALKRARQAHKSIGV